VPGCADAGPEDALADEVGALWHAALAAAAALARVRPPFAHRAAREAWVRASLAGHAAGEGAAGEHATADRGSPEAARELQAFLAAVQ
jgi:hypothetical protein